MQRPVVLCGMGRVGRRVFESLRAAGLPVVVVDEVVSPNDPRLKDARVVVGDCRNAEVLEAAGVREARGVVIVTSDDLANVSAALLARRMNPDARIVVRMFNQNLIARLGSAVKNMVTLSVSALTAPLLALTAVTGDTLGAFKLPGGAQQVAEVKITDASEPAGLRVADFAANARVLALALTTNAGESFLLNDVPGHHVLMNGDRLIVCGSPQDLRPLLERSRGDLLPGIRWAGRVRRWFRTLARTAAEVDVAMKICTLVLFTTLFASTLVFRFGVGSSWADGFYQTVTVIATGTELHGEGRPEWVKVFLSVLKIAGAALLAGFTAIFTNYLLRARLGGALELRRVPDGGHVVVCGLGNVGYRCVEELTALGERVVAIDRMNDNPFIATCRRKGVATFVGDATIGEVLRQVRASSAKAVIAATSKELVNLEIALLVREMNPSQRVVVRLTDPDFAIALREAADIQLAVSVPALAAPAFAAALFGDRVQTLFSAVGRTLVVADLIVQENDSSLAGTLLHEALREHRMFPVAIGDLEGHAVRRLPAEHRLKSGDRLTVIAELPDLEKVLHRTAIPNKG